MLERVKHSRHVDILNIIRKEVSVEILDLAEHLEVSPSTIRRDLRYLESQGLLRRISGGAIIESLPEPPFGIRRVSRRRQKDLIGRKAAEWVADGDVIFLDGGTTTEFMVPYLVEKTDLTIVTPALNVANALSNHPQDFKTIVVGGELHVESQTFTGPLTLASLELYGIRCDKAFISTGGVTAVHGAMNRILDRIPIKRKAIEISAHAAIVADGSKIGVPALGLIAPMHTFEYLFTDESAPDAEIAAIGHLGVEVIVARGADLGEEERSS